MDEVHFTEAEGNVNDLVWEYGSIHHSWMYPGNQGGLFDEDPHNVKDLEISQELIQEYNEDIGDLTSNESLGGYQNRQEPIYVEQKFPN